MIAKTSIKFGTLFKQIVFGTEIDQIRPTPQVSCEGFDPYITGALGEGDKLEVRLFSVPIPRMPKWY